MLRVAPIFRTLLASQRRTTVQKALPLLREGGSIILDASIVASKGFPDLSGYSATKAALRSFTRTFTTDLKERKIRINVGACRLHTDAGVTRVARAPIGEWARIGVDDTRIRWTVAACVLRRSGIARRRECATVAVRGGPPLAHPWFHLVKVWGIKGDRRSLRGHGDDLGGADVGS